MTTVKRQAFLSFIALVILTGCASQPQIVSKEKGPKNAVADMCAAENGAPFSYRKKVAILAADIRDPQPDLPTLDVAWSEALQRYFRDSERLLVNDASSHHLYYGPQQREWAMALAKQLDVQFIIAVRFQNLHTKRSQLGSGNYAIPLPWVQRQIDVELLIFDGYYGNQLTRFSHSADISASSGNVINPPYQPVLKGSFLDTTLGQAMSAILAAQTNDTLAALACLPLMERVFKVSGRDIYIHSQAATMIRPGDALQLFYKQGAIETHLGPVKISRVSPESAIGTYQGQVPPTFAAGLRVRAW